MRFFLTPLLTVAGILVAVTSCNNSQKLGKRINANVVLSTDTIKKKPAVEQQPSVAGKQEYDSLQVEYSNLLSVPYDSIYNLKLYGFIKEHQGKKCFDSKKLNYDCESFLPTLFNEVYGITIPATADEQVKYKNFDLFKNTRYLKPGDVLFFNNSSKQPDKITHAGFYLYNSFFVVVTANEGIVIRKTDDPYWLKHFVAAGRINKLVLQNN
jgi:NlpC/P60 family